MMIELGVLSSKTVNQNRQWALAFHTTYGCEVLFHGNALIAFSLQHNGALLSFESG